MNLSLVFYHEIQLSFSFLTEVLSDTASQDNQKVTSMARLAGALSIVCGEAN